MLNSRCDNDDDDHRNTHTRFLHNHSEWSRSGDEEQEEGGGREGVRAIASHNTFGKLHTKVRAHCVGVQHSGELCGRGRGVAARAAAGAVAVARTRTYGCMLSSAMCGCVLVLNSFCHTRTMCAVDFER